MFDTSRQATDRASRLASAAPICSTGGTVCPAERATEWLEAVIEPGDRVEIEGDNQKQADCLAAALARVDPSRVDDLHMVQPVLALPDHLAMFERGIRTGGISRTRERKAGRSPNTSPGRRSVSARSTPISSSTHACWST
jgi:hypothetical protein